MQGGKLPLFPRTASVQVRRSTGRGSLLDRDGIRLGTLMTRFPHIHTLQGVSDALCYLRFLLLRSPKLNRSKQRQRRGGRLAALARVEATEKFAVAERRCSQKPANTATTGLGVKMDGR